MPRRYRPSGRRRKTKKRSAADGLAEPLEAQDVEAAAVAAQASVSSAAPVPRGEGRHVTRDYSYVGMEIRRMAIVGGFITVSLILTGVLLR